MDMSANNGGERFPGVRAGLQEPGQGFAGPWLRGAGICALGVLVGFVLGLAATPSSMSSMSSMSSASLLEQATAERAAPAASPSAAEIGRAHV